MASTTNSRPMFHKKGLIDKKVKLYVENTKLPYKGFVNEVSTADRYYQLATVGDLPASTMVAELSEIPEDDFATPFFQQLVPRSRKSKYRVSDEAYTRDPEGIYDRIPTLLGRSITKAIDGDCAGFLARANDAAFLTTPDGLAIASASHLNADGVYTNILSTSAALSYGALELALAEWRQQESHDGDPMDFDGMVDLCVPSALVPLANRIVKAMNRHDTADHDPNWAGNQVRRIVEVRRSTSSTAWMIVAADQEYNPLMLVNGSGVKTHNWYDGDRDGHYWNIRKMWALGCKDPRGIVWSAGA